MVYSWLRGQSRANPSLAGNSLIHGKIQGILRFSAGMGRPEPQKGQGSRGDRSQIPYAGEQGIFARLQGKISGHQANSGREQRSTWFARRSAAGLCDLIPERPVPRAAPVGHLGQDWLQGIDVVVDDHLPLCGVDPMEAAGILRQRPSPRDRHGKEQRVEACIVEALAEVAPCRDDHALLPIGDTR